MCFKLFRPVLMLAGSVGHDDSYAVKRQLIFTARGLRRDRTKAEHVLWQHLRRRRCQGCKFRFQHPIPPYVADFVCLERRLIVEVDGSQHNEDVDAIRTRFLESRGFTVLRVWNNDVLQNMEGVFEAIERALLECEAGPPPLNPLPGGEGR